MSKRLKDGESRVMRPGRSSGLSQPERARLEVVAHRVDSETPYITIVVAGEYCQIDMSDVLALDLVDRIQRALSILPTSK